MQQWVAQVSAQCWQWNKVCRESEVPCLSEAHQEKRSVAEAGEQLSAYESICIQKAPILLIIMLTVF